LTVTGDEELFRNPESPAYVAVIEWAPSDKDEAENMATSLAPRGAVPRINVPPSTNVTMPAGVPAPGATGATAAVNSTDWPKVGVLEEADNVVVVFALFTVWVIGGEVLELLLASPP
jgi:hypothetical protein